MKFVEKRDIVGQDALRKASEIMSLKLIFIINLYTNPKPEDYDQLQIE